MNQPMAIRNNHARQRLRATCDHINTLRLVVVCLLAAVVGLWWRNGILQETRRLYIPPDLTQGMVTQFDKVPAPLVYTFVYYIFQQLNRWPSDGEKDYPKQIYALQGFLTPSCRTALEADMNAKLGLGELRQRVRSVQEIPGQSYTRQRVEIEARGVWNTWLDVNVVESIGGHPVKDVLLRYPLRVVRFDVDKEINPWGLALDCSEALRPILLDEDALTKPFRRSGGAL